LLFFSLKEESNFLPFAVVSLALMRVNSSSASSAASLRSSPKFESSFFSDFSETNAFCVSYLHDAANDPTVPQDYSKNATTSKEKAIGRRPKKTVPEGRNDATNNTTERGPALL
jgi:hypothetical protein